MDIPDTLGFAYRALETELNQIAVNFPSGYIEAKRTQDGVIQITIVER